MDLLNHENVHPLVTELVQQTFFKFFRVCIGTHSRQGQVNCTICCFSFQIDLNRRCPFWSDDGRCVLKDCHVEECLQVSPFCIVVEIIHYS